jgi:hypothetical protein
MRWTLLRLFRPLVGVAPDHGLWGLGRVRVYAHRGTGHYGAAGSPEVGRGGGGLIAWIGFPLRLGVPSEQSLMHVHYSLP